MTEASKAYRHAVAIAKQEVEDLKRERPFASEEEADSIVALACDAGDAVAKNRKLPAITDEERKGLRQEVARWIRVNVPESRHITAIRDEERVEWLDVDGEPIGASDFEYEYYNRYEQLLRQKPSWTVDAIRSVREESLKILRYLENPKKEGRWKRRGMVVGYVQSGKTANFTALINRAVDVGYQIVIVLTGIMEDLRQQTQGRLDAEVIGFDSSIVAQKSKLVGVGTMAAQRPQRVNVTSATRNLPGGDFNQQAHQFAPQDMPNDSCYLFVVKKNARILANLNAWLETQAQQAGYTDGRMPFSLLLIDDECDQASVNTGKNDDIAQQQNITKINDNIRRILNRFDRSSYVGYTATPFANIFIHPDANHNLAGDDLFPKDFILMLEASEEYIGANSFFGFEDDLERGIEGYEGMPVVRFINDGLQNFPQPHRSHLTVTGIPESLKDAIAYFHLVIAMRLFRGQDRDHMSMLVHVSRYVAVQNQAADKVREFNDGLATAIKLEKATDKTSETWKRLRRVYEEELMREDTRELANEAYPASFEKLAPILKKSAEKVQVEAINGSTKKKLVYPANEPRYYIAVGGDRLSRGLTLEGLTVSYFMRVSRMYDSLMQMGRWFGYRPGYLDLCRLWTTLGVYHNYRHVALAIEELKRDFRYMADRKKTPLEFGLKVRGHPTSGLIVTSRNKMESARKYQVTLGGRLLQTLAYDTEPAGHIANDKAVRAFLTALSRDQHVVRRHTDTADIFENVGPQAIRALLADFHPSSYNQPEASPDIISRYIETKVGQGELKRWTVAIPLTEGGEGQSYEVGPVKMKGVVRKAEYSRTESTVLRMRAITSPGMEAIDLTPAERKEALNLSIQDYNGVREGQVRHRKGKHAPTDPYPDMIRRVRGKERALIVLYPLDPKNSTIAIPNAPKKSKGKPGWGPLENLTVPVWGYGISLPDTGSSATVEYLGNTVFQKIWDREFDEDAEATGDEDLA